MALPSGSAGKSMEGCVMLALSTFRQSEKAVDTAIRESKGIGKLMVVYVADVNLARYFIDVDHGWISELKETCEADLLQKHEKAGREYVAAIVELAGKEGIEVNTHIEIGRFALVCLEVVRQVKPSQIITTRTKRPAWVKKFFGAPVDELIAKAGCPVTVV